MPGLSALASGPYQPFQTLLVVLGTSGAILSPMSVRTWDIFAALHQADQGLRSSLARWPLTLVPGPADHAGSGRVHDHFSLRLPCRLQSWL